MRRIRFCGAVWGAPCTLILALGLVLSLGLLCPHWIDSVSSIAGSEAIREGHQDFTGSSALGAGHHNCRLWGSIAGELPAGLIQDHLINLPRSIRQLSSYNRDGWGLVYYTPLATAPMVRRGEKAAYTDPRFDATVGEIAGSKPSIVLAHVRYCSSGLCDIPNPHPFERVKAGRHWYLAHNGTIDKDLLLSLIRPDYLADNPPYNGSNPKEWIDSELYFLYLLQTCEEMAWDVKPALGRAIQTLRLRIPEDSEQLNFILCDSDAIYAYREGISLYYQYQSETSVPISAVASQYPTLGQEDWVALTDGQLVTLTAQAPPLVENIEWYFDQSLAGQAVSPLSAGSPGTLSAFPNPFNPRTQIRFALREAGPVQLRIFDIRGRCLITLAKGEFSTGMHKAIWEGKDERGRELTSGVYLLHLHGPNLMLTERLVLIK